MNRTLTFAAVVLMAAPLFATEKPVANPTQPAAQTGDSPLVAAAKRTGRLGKKPAFVITNDNLVTKGGHFTTTNEQHPIAPGQAQPGPPPLQDKNDSAAMRAKEAEQNRQKLMRQLQMQYDGESLNADQDPARLEGQMREVAGIPLQPVSTYTAPTSVQTTPLQGTTVQPPPSTVQTSPVTEIPVQEIKKN